MHLWSFLFPKKVYLSSKPEKNNKAGKMLCFVNCCVCSGISSVSGMFTKGLDAVQGTLISDWNFNNPLVFFLVFRISLSKRVEHNITSE